MNKICVVVTIPATLKAFLVDQMQFFSRQGFEVTLISSDDGKIKNELPEGLKYIAVPMTRGVVSPLSLVSSIFRLYSIFSSHNYDIVQYSTPNAALCAAVAAWLAKVPVRLYCQWGIRYVGFSGLKKRIFKLVELLTCRLSTDVQAVSNGNLVFAEREGLYDVKKGSVIWNGSVKGVDFQRFDISKKDEWRAGIRNKYGLDCEHRIIGFIGRLKRDKGINELLASFRKLASEFPDLRLLLIGEADEKNDLDGELYSWAQDSEKVLLPGFINNVEEYLAAMDIFAFPSYREGFGMVVIEAEAMGVPVVVTNIPGPLDAMEKDKTGIIVEKGNQQELYEGLKKLLLDEDGAREMGNNGIAFVRSGFEQQELWQKILENRLALISRSVSG